MRGTEGRGIKDKGRRREESDERQETEKGLQRREGGGKRVMRGTEGRRDYR